MSRAPRHIVHLLYRFAAGGLENVIVQLVNGLPRENFRHTVVALTEVDPAFAARIERDDVEFVSLHKAPGQPFALYPKMYRLLRRLRPDVLHTCNIAALEFMPVAWLARVPLRIHAEHGWDVADPDGSNAKYLFLRRIYKYFVHEIVAVSSQLLDYLTCRVGVAQDHLHLIRNGVNTFQFRPFCAGDEYPDGMPFDPERHFIVGSVGRFEPIKNPQLLVRSFIELRSKPGHDTMRLVMVGDGPLRNELIGELLQAGLEGNFWLPGSRADIPRILRTFGCFVLPSLAEGTSCTLLEAMATGCQIVATAVGGNVDLLDSGRYGTLTKSDDVYALSAAIENRFRERQEAQTLAARDRVESEYSMAMTLRSYTDLFGA